MIIKKRIGSKIQLVTQILQNCISDSFPPFFLSVTVVIVSFFCLPKILAQKRAHAHAGKSDLGAGSGAAHV